MATSSGKHALGISDRSGFRYPLNRMRREWTGALVGPDEYEAKHPQLEPPRRVLDAEALSNPRPDVHEGLSVYPGRPTVETPNEAPLTIYLQLGEATVTGA